MKIVNRFTDATLFENECNTMKKTLEAAVKARANLAEADLARADLAGAYLAGADLAGADLADANLARADLAGADLAGADLADAYLAGADLAGADLADANLARANLAEADLARADLAGAYLTGAYLAGADLAEADLADAYLAGADLAGADLADANLARAYLARAYLADAYLAEAVNVPASVATQDRATWTRLPKEPAERVKRYRELHPDVPVVAELDRKILAAIESGGGLEMARWHSCETTHCLAGWAVHLAGEKGKDLEQKYGPQRAGTLIYNVSTGRAPHFFASNERALADLRERVAKS